MTHLRIEQTVGQTEYISTSTAKKLYDIAKSGTLDVSSNLQGTCHIQGGGYDVYKTFLEAKFPDFHLSMDKQYVLFEDSLCESIIATQIGDGTGVTLAEIQSYGTGVNAPVSVPKSWFYDSTQGAYRPVTKFNEFILFTGLRQIDAEMFKDNTYLTEISIPYVSSSIGGSTFRNCSSLTKVVLDSRITELSGNMFLGAPIEQINMGNVQYFSNNCFNWCQHIQQSCYDFSSAISIGIAAFSWSSFDGDVVIPATCTNLGNTAFYKTKVHSIEILSPTITLGTSIFADLLQYPTHAILRCTTVPTFPDANPFPGQYPIYVVDSLLSSYQSASGWSGLSSRLHGISELT